MMRLIAPIRGIKPQPIAPVGGEIYISQAYGNVWIADRDMIVGGRQIYKGDNVYLKVFGLKGHNGTDIVAPKGTEVVAVRDGWVIESVSKDTGYGLRTILAWEYDGFVWVAIYGHLWSTAFEDVSWNLNRRDIPVKAGTVLGTVDSTGFSTGHHLHFGGAQYKNGKKLNLNNGYGSDIDLWPYIRKNYMEFFQVGGEQTVVAKNDNGKYIEFAMSPELYPYAKKLFALQDSLPVVSRAEVDANKIGQAKAGITLSL